MLADEGLLYNMISGYTYWLSTLCEGSDNDKKVGLYVFPSAWIELQILYIQFGSYSGLWKQNGS